MKQNIVVFSVLLLMHQAVHSEVIKGAPGSKKEKADKAEKSLTYASARANTQRLLFSNQIPIDFANDVVTPIGVIHPTAGSTSNFKVKKAGVYLVSWTVNVEWGNTTKNEIVVDLFNVSSQTSLFKSSQTFDPITLSGGARSEVISGQIVLQLAAKDIVALRIQPSSGPINVTGGVFNLVSLK